MLMSSQGYPTHPGCSCRRRHPWCLGSNKHIFKHFFFTSLSMRKASLWQMLMSSIWLCLSARDFLEKVGGYAVRRWPVSMATSISFSDDCDAVILNFWVQWCMLMLLGLVSIWSCQLQGESCVNCKLKVPAIVSIIFPSQFANCRHNGGR